MLAIVLLLALQDSGEPREIPLSLRVNQAISLGVDYLRGQQEAGGRWSLHDGAHPGGMTALAAFTLLKSGVRRDDPALTKALAALAGNEWKSTYSAACHLLLLEALRDPARRAEGERTLAFLLENQQNGVWGYPWGHLCNSNTQFALLGLRAARRVGLEVPDPAFIAAAEGLEHFRSRDGGYLYEPGRPESYAGMTAASLASYAVIAEVARESAKVRAALKSRADDVAAAEAWLEPRFEAGRNRYANDAWTPFWHHSYLWSIERWCGLTERKTIAGRDWYVEGAEFLLATQARDGSWTSDDHPLENTCFALLFLRRATVSPDGELAAVDAELARRRAERPEVPERPPGATLRLVEWTLCGPWSEQGDESLLLEPPFEPAKFKAGTKRALARREPAPVRLKADGWTDLEALTGRGGDRLLWALATRLVLPAGGAPFEGYLWLEVEDGYDVWLDGKRLVRERRRGAAINGSVRLDVTLAPGTHELVVLLEDVGGASAFGARLGDRASGAPPAGLVHTSAPAK